MSYEFSVGRFKNGRNLDRALRDVQRPLRAAGVLQVGRIQRAFASGGHQNHGGEAWAPWSPAYAARQEKRGRSKVLVDTGILRNSITYGVIDVGGKSALTVGTNVAYAKIHQFGFNGAVSRKAFAQNDIRKRGKWGTNRQGQRVWRKGRRQVGVWRHFEAASFRMTIPARPPVAITKLDVATHGASLRAWAREQVNGRGVADGA